MELSEMKNGKCIALVSCVKTKSDRALPAKNLYISTWFKKAQSLVERSGAEWFILSAKHGLLNPNDKIEPYEQTLKIMDAAERRVWAAKVIDQMDILLPDADKVIILAGVDYRTNLMQYLYGRFASIDIPLKGLKSGQQLQWLTNAKTI